MDKQSGILLESGTNELELIEFQILDQSFGINVLKVREIIQPLPITNLPHAHHFILGIIQLRGEVLPVISLERALGIESIEERERKNDKFLITEFNRQKFAFHIHDIKKIQRISWEEIQKPTEFLGNDPSNVIGVINNNEHIVLLLDYEKIIVDINPELGVQASKIAELGFRERSNKKIIVAEDSMLLRDLLKETLSQAGYSNVVFFENGREALDYIHSIVEKGSELYKEIQLLITDIEMPIMDGHYLTKQIKENPATSKLPVIIFSSLITDHLYHKGELVGAVSQVSKPEIDKLVLEIDKHII